VTQSVAILVYLADKHGLLMPSDARARALAVEGTMLAATDVAGTATQIFITEHRLPGDDASKTWLAEFHAGRMHKYMAECERRVAANGGWLAGTYSIADIVLFSTMNRPDFRKYILGRPEYPALGDWHARIAARPAVQRALAAKAP
jgi:GST-like protein